MDINQILDKASRLKIAVVGDVIEDIFVSGTVDRVSPEGPFLVLNQKQVSIGLGGAGNVFLNLLNLGVDVDLYCNADYAFWSYDFRNRILWNEFPHSRKTRFMSGNHHLLRVDKELTQGEIEWHIFKNFSWWKDLTNKIDQYDAIVVADYHKGVLSDSAINTLMEFKQITGKPIVVDTKKDFKRYNGATIIKCNLNEWQNRGLSPEALWTVITSGENGMVAFPADTDEGIDIKGIKVPIVDVCGAGDTVTAILGIAAAIGEDGTGFKQWLELANIAAAEVCRYPGVHAITKEELIKAYLEINPVHRTGSKNSR